MKMKRLLIGAVLVLGAVVSGCGERREDPAVLQAEIVKGEAGLKQIGQSMNDLTMQVKAKLKTDDMSKVMMEVRKSPEWQRLSEEVRKTSEDLAAKRERLNALKK